MTRQCGNETNYDMTDAYALRNMVAAEQADFDGPASRAHARTMGSTITLSGLVGA